MPVDEYLKSCGDVPPLPPGLWWHVTTQESGEVQSTHDGEEVLVNYTRVIVEICDPDGLVKGLGLFRNRTASMERYPDVFNNEFRMCLKRAYADLYSLDRVNYQKVVQLGK